ncbi:acyloxyacyl hydrolase [Planctomycetales bacterium ZRK34]|nr:acyloxyacyl hydrolase [Planctomycetales bacterium ZRK34]
MMTSVVVLVMVAALGSPLMGAEKMAMDEEPSAFAEGNWTIGPIGGYIAESFGGNDEELYFGGAAVEYYAWDDIAIVGEFLGYYIDQSEDTEGLGFNLLGRWHFWKPCKAVALYVEAGAGLIEGFDNIPSPNGTYHNFTLHAGGGFKINLGDNVNFLAGGRYFHLSNASIHGADRNPSLDGFCGYGGVLINF